MLYGDCSKLHEADSGTYESELLKQFTPLPGQYSTRTKPLGIYGRAELSLSTTMTVMKVLTKQVVASLQTYLRLIQSLS